MYTLFMRKQHMCTHFRSLPADEGLCSITHLNHFRVQNDRMQYLSTRSTAFCRLGYRNNMCLPGCYFKGWYDITVTYQTHQHVRSGVQ